MGKYDEDEPNRRVYGIWYKRRRLSHCCYCCSFRFRSKAVSGRIRNSFRAPGPVDTSFLLQKKEITRKHKQKCVSVVERIYGEDTVMDGDLIVINFFALVLLIRLFFYKRKRLQENTNKNVFQSLKGYTEKTQ
ncbi:uncharacterized protein LOC131019373 [Salvia miltiorrhiza]|uniref:uncharacterized protein LOC131019373 n=1 Tax=Salvia miltiorrhiza TaxID=226208 RepID=UPI0025ABD30A|nr:uncharacterized protein LOC131019373 [Salvia miltiorrhiza]